MINCERCKQKITLHDLVIVRDKETGVAKKYCQACATIINIQQEGKKSTSVKKEKEKEKERDEPLPKTTPEKTLEPEPYTTPDSESSLVMEEANTEPLQSGEINSNFTDIVPREHIVQRIETYLGEQGLNIANDDYCYIKIVGNHLEIGRAKIVLEE